MKRIAVILIVLLVSVACTRYGPLNTSSQSNIEYDTYEMAESGTLIRFPKNTGTHATSEMSDIGESLSSGIEKQLAPIEYDVYELAESGMQIKFPKKRGRRTPDNSSKDRKAANVTLKLEAPEIEYDVYEMAESGMLIKFPK